MHNAIASPPAAVNEPVRSYAPGSPERVSLRSTLMTMREDEVEILPVIDGVRYSVPGDRCPKPREVFQYLNIPLICISRLISFA